MTRATDNSANRPHTLVVPAGWGRKGQITDLTMRLIMALGPEQAKNDIAAREQVNCELRKDLQQRGIRIREVEQVLGLEQLAQGQATVCAASAPDIAADLPTIAPGIEAIASKKIEAFDRDPHFPVVAYVCMESLAGGEGKYLLDNEEQYRKLCDFFASGSQAKALQSSFRFKEYIPTPSSHYTSYRIIAAANGEILFGGLLYSSHVKQEMSRHTADIPAHELGRAGANLLDYLVSPASPYYLGTRRFTSNVAGGGKCIPLNPTPHSRPITPEEAGILAAHDIRSQAIPAGIAAGASTIARHLGPRTGLVFGIDFIQNPQGTEYLLEVNLGPGLQVVAETVNYGQKDAEVSYRALMTRAVAAVFG